MTIRTRYPDVADVVIASVSVYMIELQYETSAIPRRSLTADFANVRSVSFANQRSFVTLARKSTPYFNDFCDRPSIATLATFVPCALHASCDFVFQFIGY